MCPAQPSRTRSCGQSSFAVSQDFCSSLCSSPAAGIRSVEPPAPGESFTSLSCFAFSPPLHPAAVLQGGRLNLLPLWLLTKAFGRRHKFAVSEPQLGQGSPAQGRRSPAQNAEASHAGFQHLGPCRGLNRKELRVGRGSGSGTAGGVLPRAGVASGLLNLHPTPANGALCRARLWLSAPARAGGSAGLPRLLTQEINVQLQLEECSGETAKAELLALELLQTLPHGTRNDRD